jgi:hypothetical protein
MPLAMIDLNAPVTEAELDHAEAAIEEEQETGTTNRRCLRCGGRYIFEPYASGYVIRCENGDFNTTARGI